MVQRWASLGLAVVLALGLTAGPARTEAWAEERAGAWAEERALATPGGEIRVEVVRPDPAKAPAVRLIWLLSRFGEAEGQRAHARSLAAAGLEVWIVDLLAELFLPNLASSYEQVPAAVLAALIDAAVAPDGPPVALFAQGRGALPALTGARAYRAAGDAGPFAGVILSSASLYARSPQPGEMPEPHPALAELPLAVALLQPQFSPRYVWLDLNRQLLAAAGAAVWVAPMPGVRGGFWFRPDPSAAEQAALAALPATLVDLVQRLETLRP